MCERLATTFLASHANSTAVLPRLWLANRDVVVHAMLALYKQEAANISRVLDVCEELEALNAVLDASPFNFAIELAALAASRDLLSIETWLQRKISFHRLPFHTVRHPCRLVVPRNVLVLPIRGCESSAGHHPLRGTQDPRAAGR